MAAGLYIIVIIMIWAVCFLFVASWWIFFPNLISYRYRAINVWLKSVLFFLRSTRVDFTMSRDYPNRFVPIWYVYVPRARRCYVLDLTCHRSREIFRIKSNRRGRLLTCPVKIKRYRRSRPNGDRRRRRLITATMWGRPSIRMMRYLSTPRNSRGSE